MVLANAMQIELTPDLRGFGDTDPRFMFLELGGQFLVQDLLAQNDAVVADVHSRAGD